MGGVGTGCPLPFVLPAGSGLVVHGCFLPVDGGGEAEWFGFWFAFLASSSAA